MCGLISVTFALIRFVKHPARRKCVLGRTFIRVRLYGLGICVDLADHLAGIFQRDRKVILGLADAFFHLCSCFFERIQLHTGKAVHCGLFKIFKYISCIGLKKRTQYKSFCFDSHFLFPNYLHIIAQI